MRTVCENGKLIPQLSTDGNAFVADPETSIARNQSMHYHLRNETHSSRNNDSSSALLFHTGANCLA